MQIRSATLEDAEAIASLASQLGYPAASAEVAQRYAVLQQRSDHAVFVAEEQDGTVSGWVHVFLARRLFMPAFAELGGIVVEETRRGAGVGSALLVEAENWASDNGCPFLRIRSNTQRAGAHQFYERVGYTAFKTQLVFDKQLPDLQDA